MSHTEWAYSSGLVVPAELVDTDPANIEALVQRDLGGQRSPSMYRTADPDALNSLNVMVVRRTGDPATKWETVVSESPAKTREAGADYYDITQTWSENPDMEVNREIARGEVRAWGVAWENSEFTHEATVYDANPDQERRISLTDARGRDDATFTTSWYAKDQTRVDFPNEATFRAFVVSAYDHIEVCNNTFETSMQGIDQAANTAQLDSVLASLPPIPGGPSTRATGPLPGGQVDARATKPRKRR